MTSEISEREEMALNENDRGWIKNTVSEALQERSKSVKDAIRTWSLPSVSVAIILFTLTQWDKYAEFRTHTADRLDSIDAKLLNLSPIASAPKVINEIASLGQKALGEALPALSRATEKLPSKAQQSEPLTRIATNLGSLNPQTSGYWSAASKFLQFASLSFSNGRGVAGAATGGITIDIGATLRITGGRMEKESYLMNGTLEARDSVFVRCKFTFSRTTALRLHNVAFVDCVFDFDPDSDPDTLTPTAKDTVRMLIASGIQHAVIQSVG